MSETSRYCVGKMLVLCRQVVGRPTSTISRLGDRHVAPVLVRCATCRSSVGLVCDLSFQRRFGVRLVVPASFRCATCHTASFRCATGRSSVGSVCSLSFKCRLGVGPAGGLKL